MITCTVRYADMLRGPRNWGPFITKTLEQAGFDPDRIINTEVSRDMKSMVFYQEDHATYEDVLKRLESIERLLNIQ